MYLFSTPRIIRKVHRRDLTWELPNDNNSIYITFDDGPNPETTPFILEELEKYSAKATFFCLGKNVDANPTVYDSILKHGHAVGNHTFNHYNGWKTNTRKYLEDVERCNKLIKSSLFRPPYGKIKHAQLRALRNNYSIIMWSSLSGDFDTELDKEKCLSSLLNNPQRGDIVVFHDSLKAKEKVKFALPSYLKYLYENNYKVIPIPNMKQSSETTYLKVG
jgi:peptidoglycan/xylan/chitin deacetylase (PgdA/CDA1 family)